MTSYTLDVKNLDFFYGKNQVLRQINLSVKAHTITALMGHSGSGKSTLIRIFNRIYELSPGSRAVGEIYFEGLQILDAQTDLLSLRRRIGMVFQKPTPFPMSIYENIAFGVSLYEKLSKPEMTERVIWALEKAGLWEEVKDKLAASSLNLSQGQQQRLCIARAIALKPEVLLLDEPTASLDPMSSSTIEELLLELKKEYTILIVTHNLKQAKRTADITAHMHHGEIITCGPTSLVFSNPSHLVTKKYIEFAD
ncbi:MAG: ATP-binding cassette domain-containing protein [Alphaproteobacteria bacterium]|nr:ATP-binding cassette domain-containing protein [Alphaproteobacteria bacterium]